MATGGLPSGEGDRRGGSIRTREINFQTVPWVNNPRVIFHNFIISIRATKMVIWICHAVFHHSSESGIH